ncbi:MAG: rpmG [Bacillales bacterium]|jgi:large subunit ribosomal protein L33|nr:rpmG [Bacillales bacterium]
MKKMILACEKCGSRNYTVPETKDKTARLEIKKFCKTCNAHNIHKQTV